MPPSESPDRMEVVMLAAESFGEFETEIPPILRSDSGKFFGFDEPDARKLDQLQGRFANLLPPEPVDEEMRGCGFSTVGLHLSYLVTHCSRAWLKILISTFFLRSTGHPYSGAVK